ncbi:MAG: HAD family hydrolase [Thermodesulfovibrionales bacterium]|nr:HAD family hydrolase [Thermodesulfovibrionales bacterium]
MKNKAVLFDLYGTLINIKTDEGDIGTYEILSRYLKYHLVYISADALRKTYFEAVQQHLSQSKEPFPEVDVYKVFFDIMHSFGKKKYPSSTVIDVSMLFRSLTIRRFEPFEGIFEVLDEVSKQYKTALVSDAQWVFTKAEIKMLGLERFFRHIILSSKYGFKKPDKRLFNIALKKLGIRSEEAVYIGDNPARDLVGAKMVGMKFLLFRNDCKSYNGFEADGFFYDYKHLMDLLTGI